MGLAEIVVDLCGQILKVSIISGNLFTQGYWDYLEV